MWIGIEHPLNVLKCCKNIDNGNFCVLCLVKKIMGFEDCEEMFVGGGISMTWRRVVTHHFVIWDPLFSTCLNETHSTSSLKEKLDRKERTLVNCWDSPGNSDERSIKISELVYIPLKLCKINVWFLSLFRFVVIWQLFFSMSGFGQFLGTFSAKNMVIGGDARSRFLFWSKWEMVAK